MAGRTATRLLVATRAAVRRAENKIVIVAWSSRKTLERCAIRFRQAGGNNYPDAGKREDFYSVRERPEINDNNSNNSARRGSATGQSAAVRRVA
jgi:hypothetical protein